MEGAIADAGRYGWIGILHIQGTDLTLHGSKLGSDGYPAVHRGIEREWNVNPATLYVTKRCNRALSGHKGAKHIDVRVGPRRMYRLSLITVMVT